MQAINLNSFEVLAVSGSDAKKFLQGQVTCDINQLSPARSLTGALCNLKGRVIASFRLVEYNDTCYLLLPAGMSDIVQPVLNKYIVSFKAQCHPPTIAPRCTGLIGSLDDSPLKALFPDLPAEEDDVATGDRCLLIRIPGEGPRHELWDFSQSVDPRMDPPVTFDADTPLATWALSDIKAGILHITPELSEQHLPETLNYDLSGVINFKKGCYTGQEIIARMYYRGTAKRRLYYGVAAECTGTPAAISTISGNGEQAVEGELLRVVNGDDGKQHLLAVLPVSASEPSTQVILNHDEQCQVRIHSLPYMIQ